MRCYRRAASRQSGKHRRFGIYPTWVNIDTQKRKKAAFHSGLCSRNINKSREAADKITQMRNVCSSICRLIVALIIPFRLHQLTDVRGRLVFGSNCYLILKRSGLDCILIVILRNSSGRSAEWRQQQPSRMSVSGAYTAI